MPLVEVVRTELHRRRRLRAPRSRSRERIGKEPIRCNDTPGFVVNRILIPLLNDCVRVLDEARVTPEDVDTAMQHGAGWPMGPCALHRPDRRRRPRARVRGAVRRAARAADGAAARLVRMAQAGTARPQDRPRLLRLRRADRRSKTRRRTSASSPPVMHARTSSPAREHGRAARAARGSPSRITRLIQARSPSGRSRIACAGRARAVARRRSAGRRAARARRPIEMFHGLAARPSASARRAARAAARDRSRPGRPPRTRRRRRRSRRAAAPRRRRRAATSAASRIGTAPLSPPHITNRRSPAAQAHGQQQRADDERPRDEGESDREHEAVEPTSSPPSSPRGRP